MATKQFNRPLANAKAARQDEFYTQYVDIQKEVEAYLEFDPDTFRGKVVYCNCDDPFESNFFKYFAANFNKLGLKKLITTSYDGSPIAGGQLALPEFNEGNGVREKPKAIAVEIDEVKDVTGDGAVGIEDVRLFLERNHHTRTPLAGSGDFRSPECVALLKQADIVVTNPPFSLFREYVAQLMEHKKRFLTSAPRTPSPKRRFSRSSKTRNYGSGPVSPMGMRTSAFPPTADGSLPTAFMTRTQVSSSFGTSAGSQTWTMAAATRSCR